MTPADLKPLLNIADARNEAAQSHMATIKAREQKLRQQIADLDEQFAQAALTDPETMHRMQRLGAQNLWSGWMTTRKREMNMALALVLADKQDFVRVLQKASGQRDALQSLLDEAVKAQKRKTAARDQENLLALNLHASSFFAD